MPPEGLSPDVPQVVGLNTPDLAHPHVAGWGVVVHAPLRPYNSFCLAAPSVVDRPACPVLPMPSHPLLPSFSLPHLLSVAFTSGPSALSHP